MTNLFRAVGMAAWSIRSAFACVLRGRIWLPFLLIATIEVLTLTALLNWHRPALSWLEVPILETLAGKNALRYPVFFLALPSVYSVVALVLAVLVTCVMVGAAMILFAKAYGSAQAKPAWATARRRYPALLAVTGVLAVLLYAAAFLRAVVPNQAFLENPMVRWGTRGGVLLISIVIQTLLAYAALWILLRGHGIVASLRESFRLARATFFPTFFVIGAAAVILYPLNFFSARGDLFVDKFRPETVTAILLWRIGLEFVIGFFLVGAITRIFLYQTEEARA